jgi:hypothetical protein
MIARIALLILVWGVGLVSWTFWGLLVVWLMARLLGLSLGQFG